MNIFEVAINAFSALIGLVFAYGLLRRQYLERTHVLAALFVGFLSLAFLLRSLEWVLHGHTYMRIGYIFFSIAPLFALLFFEHVTRIILPVALKVVAIVTVVALVVSLALSSQIQFSRGWGAALAVWHTFVVLFSLQILFQSARSPKTPARLRSVQWALFFAMAAMSILSNLDWLRYFGVNTPRLAPLALLVLVHVLYRIFNAPGDFSLRKEGSIIFSGLFGFVLFACIMQMIPPEDTITATPHIIIVILACQLPTVFMLHYLLRIRRVTGQSILERLNRIRLTDLPRSIDAFSQLEEVQKAVWMSQKTLNQLACDLTDADIQHYNQNPYVSLSGVEAKIETKTLLYDERLRLEKARHLLLTHGIESIYFIDAAKGFIGFSFTRYMDQFHYQELAILFGSISRLLPTPEVSKC